MCRTCFEDFIRFGGTKTFVLNFDYPQKLAQKQGVPTSGEEIRQWVESVWNQSFGAASQAILKDQAHGNSQSFEFSPSGLSDLDKEALKNEAVLLLESAIDRVGIDLNSADGQQRALAVLFGFLNQAQQIAMKIKYYTWATRKDKRVREGHAVRDGKIFRWDDPPEGGHPTQDFGCRCYARALGIEGYWQRIKPSVDAYTSDVDRFEGSVDHMYLDSKDNVTVGIGTLLASSDAAAALAFRHRDTDKPATDAEIRAEFDLIDSMTGSNERGAGYYREFTTLYLPQNEVDKQVIDHMRGDFDDLLRMFPYFGNYPLSAQIALWDMIYNLGPGGLRREFPLMRQAIENENWEEAARQSHRQDIGDERNYFVFNQFMQAAQDP